MSDLKPLPDYPARGSLWRHRKGGTYRVWGVGRVESTLDVVVVYSASGLPDIWTRPIDEFLDGRFDQIGDPRTPEPKQSETSS